MSLTGALAFLDRVKAVLVEKNAAYGDSAGNPIRVFSKADAAHGLLVRIDDKLSRIAHRGYDAARDEYMNRKGFHVLRFRNEELFETMDGEDLIEKISQIIGDPRE